MVTTITPWTRLDPVAPLSLVADLSLLTCPHLPSADEVRVLQVTLHGRQAAVRHGLLGATDPAEKITVDAHRPIADLCAAEFNEAADHVLVVPPVTWSARSGLFGPRSATEIQHDNDPGATFPTRDILGLLASLPLPDGAPARSQPALAHRQVSEAKESYGALASDIIYRIENAALFDPSVELTKQYHLLLMRWEDEGPRLSAEEAKRLALEIRLAFDTARRHAESVGMSHLPRTARATAARAVKAAHLARSATTDGERAVATSHVVRLLGTLTLYYLPRPDEVPMMIGGGAPQLEHP